MTRTTYIIFIILSIILGIVLVSAKDSISIEVMPFLTLIPFFLFVSGVHGFIVHSFTMSEKMHMAVFPLLMGIIYVFLLFVHMFLLLPWICPDFRW